jgi:putative transposase
LKLDSQIYRLDHLILRIPTTPGCFVYLTLEGSDYHLSLLDDPTLKRGSVTISEGKVSIAISKDVNEIETLGHLGIDVNERNVTWADSTGRVQKDDTSEVAELKERYREIRAKIARRVKNDMRVQRRLLSKYGKREKQRTTERIHLVTKKIVEEARTNQLGIVMEKLNGIRKLYGKGNGQGRSYHGRLNSWAFREIQIQVEYKAQWEGIPVLYINARGTSSKCPNCGSSLVRLEGRTQAHVPFLQTNRG